MPRAEFQVDSLDTGWTSGRLPLKDGATVDVSLSKSGENAFKVFVFDYASGPLALEQDKIVITRTAATVDAIPASHSIGIAVLETLVLCSQSLFRFADLGDDGLCRGGPDKGCGVIVSAIDVVVDRLD